MLVFCIRIENSRKNKGRQTDLTPYSLSLLNGQHTFLTAYPNLHAEECLLQILRHFGVLDAEDGSSIKKESFFVS